MPPTQPEIEETGKRAENGQVSPDVKANGTVVDEPATTNGHDATSASADENEDDPDLEAPADETDHATNNTSLQAKLKLFESPPPFQPSSIKVGKEIARLNEVIRECSNEAVQAVLREHWKEFLFAEDAQKEAKLSIDDHVSFVVRAGITNASMEVIDAFVHSAKKNPKFTASALGDATPEQIEDFIPQSVLDKVLKERLQTLHATQLIKWLAEADRLGYSQDDIIDNDDESVVIPNVPSPSRHQSEDVEMAGGVQELPYQPPQQQSDPLLVAQNATLANSRQIQQITLSRNANANGINGNVNLVCYSCGLHFSTTSGYHYHVTKKVCAKQPPVDGWKDTCSNCAQGFTTKQGLNYHTMNRVCQGDIARATPPVNLPSTLLQQETVTNYRPEQAIILPPPTQVRSSSTTPLPTIERQNPNPQPLLSRPPMRTPTQPTPPTPVSSQQPSRQIQRPPVHTFTPVSTSRPASQVPSQNGSSSGTRKQSYANSPETRVTPNSLPPEKFAELSRQLDEVDRKFEESVAANNADTTMTEEERSRRYISLKNGNASRKSQIRKQFGVSLRLRDKDKKAMKAQGLKPEYPKNDNYKASRTSMNGTQQTPHYIDPHYSSSRDSPADGLSTSQTPPTSSFTPLNRPSAGVLTRIGAPGSHEGFGVIRKDTDRRSSSSVRHVSPTSFNPIPLKRRRTSTPSNASRSRPSSSHSNNDNRTAPLNHLPPLQRFEELRRQIVGQPENATGKEIIEVLSSDEEQHNKERSGSRGASGGANGIADETMRVVNGDGEGSTSERSGSGS